MDLEQPTWENIVNQITIPGHHGRLLASAQIWSDLLDLIRLIDGNLVTLMDKIRTSFAGQGARALIDHLEKLHQALAKVVSHYGSDGRPGAAKIADALRHCGRHLELAVGAIPIPTWVATDVRAKQREYEQAGRFTPFGRDEFWNRASNLDAAKHYVYDWTIGWFTTDEYTAARTAQQRLNSDYRIGLGMMPEATQVPVPVPGSADGPGGPGTRRPPGSDLNTAIPPLNTGLGTGLNAFNPATNPPVPPTTTGLNAADLGNTGLPPSNFTGSGIGSSLAGLSDFGGAGRIGPLVSADAMMGAGQGAGGAFGQAGAAGARLAATGGLAGGGLAGSGFGMIPAGMGAGLSGAGTGTGDQHNTQLVEDDKSIFGLRPGDEDLPSDVIG